MNKLKFNTINEEDIDLGNWMNNLWAVTCAVLKEIETTDISRKYWYFFRKSHCRWYRVFGGLVSAHPYLWPMNVLHLSYFPLFIDDDVLQWLSLKCLISHIFHDFPSLGILTSTSISAGNAYVVGWVGRVQNKWPEAAWKKTALISPVSCLIDTDIIHTTKINSDY